MSTALNVLAIVTLSVAGCYGRFGEACCLQLQCRIFLLLLLLNI